MTVINAGDLKGLFESVAFVMAEKAEELCEMDARMGDGDLGLTMKKGFGALPEVFDQLEEADIGKRLMKAGMKMASVAPSTMGTLMASGIMAGGKAIVGKPYMDAAAFCAYLEGFCRGIMNRGKCRQGDRTVLDAVGSAADKASQALRADPALTLEAAAKIALKGAEEGAQETRRMAPKFGKAAIHKKAAEGTADQGACAGMYMMKGYCDYICGKGC